MKFNLKKMKNCLKKTFFKIEFPFYLFLFFIIALNYGSKCDCKSFGKANRYSIQNRIIPDGNTLSKLEQSNQSKLNRTILNQNLINSNDHYASLLLLDKLNLITNDFYFNETFDNLIIQYGHESALWLLTQFKDASNNKVYFCNNSDNHYVIFNKFEQFSIYFEQEIQIDNFYVNSLNPNMVC